MYKSKMLVSLFGLLVVLSMLLAACVAPAAEPGAVQEPEPAGEEEPVAEEEPAVAPEEKKVLFVTTGPGDLPTLDPSLAEDTSSIQLAIEMFPGLTRPEEVTNEVLPGMAESWDVSADGTVYTFKLREGVPWVEYDPVLEEVVQVLDDEGNPRIVTANDFLYGFLRTLNPETGSPYAYVLGFVVEGADAFNVGDTDDPETVGIKVIDDNTMEITFLAPAAYNAAIAGMWMGYAQPAWLIEEIGDRWIEPGNIQGYGPFVLKDWIHDYEATLIKNPFWLGTPEMPVPALDEVNFRFIDTPEALAEYEAGNMDVSAVPSEDLDRVRTDPVLSTELYTAADFCVYYYGFNTTKPPVDDARVRRALSYAVDRVSLVENVLKGGQVPAQWIENPGLAAAPTLEEFPDAGIKYDAEMAKATLQEYLDEKGVTADSLDITLQFNTGAGHQMIAEAVQSMWAETLGVNVKLTNQEWAVHLESVDSGDAPQMFRLAWCLDYADANNFTKDVFAAGGNSNPVNPAGGIQWFNQAYEDLVVQAAQELDNDARQELYVAASEILVVEDAVAIPIYWYSRNTLTKPYVTRTFSTGGHEHYEKWDVDLSAK